MNTIILLGTSEILFLNIIVSKSFYLYLVLNVIYKFLHITQFRQKFRLKIAVSEFLSFPQILTSSHLFFTTFSHMPVSPTASNSLLFLFLCQLLVTYVHT